MPGTFSGSIITTLGKKTILNRSYKTVPDFTIPTKFQVGVNADTPNIADTELDNAIPISDGTVLDGGDTTFTGENSGTTSTDNTSTFKEGAGTTDATAQNFFSGTFDGTGTTSTTKTWASGSMSNDSSGSEAGFFFYIKDSTAYNKLSTSGTAVTMRLGSGTNNYYYKEWLNSEVATGWNWLRSGTAVTNLSMSGSVNGPISIFVVEVETNNATDTFSTGDIIYDLLREWSDSDLFKNWISGTYPKINESSLVVEMRGELTTTDANGFDIDSFGDFNTDSPNKMTGEDVFTEESKSSSDKFTFIIENRVD